MVPAPFSRFFLMDMCVFSFLSVENCNFGWTIPFMFMTHMCNIQLIIRLPECCPVQNQLWRYYKSDVTAQFSCSLFYWPGPDVGFPLACNLQGRQSNKEELPGGTSSSSQYSVFTWSLDLVHKTAMVMSLFAQWMFTGGCWGPAAIRFVLVYCLFFLQSFV